MGLGTFIFIYFCMISKIIGQRNNRCNWHTVKKNFYIVSRKGSAFLQSWWFCDDDLVLKGLHPLLESDIHKLLSEGHRKLFIYFHHGIHFNWKEINRPEIRGWNNPSKEGQWNLICYLFQFLGFESVNNCRDTCWHRSVVLVTTLVSLVFWEVNVSSSSLPGVWFNLEKIPAKTLV